jgi:N-acetylglucosaminyldiphosphoundecaprenol N-acetyl-beta-D-mannosaminyltransferase
MYTTYTPPPTVPVWGVPFAPLTFRQTLEEVEELIACGSPSYFITANVHYAMLTASDPRLDEVNRNAAFVVADGMPLVWATFGRSQRLPERVAGSDLLPALCEQAAAKGHRVYFLGGAPGVGAEAAARLRARFPALQVVGVASPPFRPLTAEEHARLIADVRAAEPDLLFVAFGQPKGEMWVAENCATLGVPVCVQVGASLDFAAGRVPRAPRWVQRAGLEWVYRLYQEPRRLLYRYLCNGLFVLRMVARDALGLTSGSET